MFSDKIVLVTGGSRGIGKAICLRFAEQGADVCINYNSSKDKALEVKTAIEKMGKKAGVYQCDVSDEDQVEAMFKAIESDFGRVDILINNAGIGTSSFLLFTNREKWDNTIGVNLNSVYFCCKRAVKMMMQNRYGAILNISSLRAVSGAAGATAYSASKAALSGFTQSLCKELGKSNIRVNSVLPGLIETDILGPVEDEAIQATIRQIPNRRMGKPEEVADLVTYLCSDKASYVNGQSIIVDGGLSA